MPIPAPPAAPAVPVIEEAPPTPESDLMDQVREMADPPTAIPLKLNVNYYLARGDSTAATLTLEVPAESLPPGTDPETLIVSAEVLDAATGESAQRFFQDDQFGASTEGEGVDGVHLFQSQRSFLPGKYRAVFAVKDPSSGTVGVLKRDIEVPQFNAADLAISTVTFVHTLERLPEAEETETFEPFVLGNFKVVPRTDVTYRHGEELTFYYQIYGAQKDETTGKPKVDLTYAFEKKHGGRWIMLGREPLRFAGQDALVQAYGLTIQPSFPGGDYRVRIEVTDTLSGRKKSVELPFIVDAPEKAAK